MNTPFNINIYLANGVVEIQIDEQIDIAFHEASGDMVVIANISRAELKDLAGQLHYAWEKSAGIAKKKTNAEMVTKLATTTTDVPCNIIADED